MISVREEIVEAAISWMARPIDRALVERARHEAASRSEEKKQGLIPAVLRKINEVTLAVSPPTLERRRAREEARRYSGATTRDSECDVASELAAAICKEWKQPLAAMLARAWLEGSDFDVESLMSSDQRTLALIVGVAAAAVLVAVVLLVRRGRTVGLPQRPALAPSPDFEALLAVAAGVGQAAGIAARLKESITEPWSWTVPDALDELAAADTHALLEAFAERGACKVKRIAPIAGERFDVRTMHASTTHSNDDDWIVAADASPGEVGFFVRDHVALPARVDVCTADWWVLAKPSCPVGSLISDRADALVSGGKAAAGKWRAPWGLAHPEDLRKLVEEPKLDAWRRRMVEELNAYYQRRPERCLSIVGAPGDVFEASIMEAAGTSPVGDAVVEDVAERDGVKQFGLACPGGSPLLLAVVHAKPARMGS